MEVRGTSPCVSFQGFKGKTGHPGLPGPKVRGTSGQQPSLFSLDIAAHPGLRVPPGPWMRWHSSTLAS